MWESNVLQVRDYSIICGYSAKWLNGSQITKALPDCPGYDKGVRDDLHLAKDLREYLDAADIVVAHNGDDFDIKVIKSRIIYHNLTPPAPFQSVDTKKVAKKVFRFPSNSLDNLCKFLRLGKKDNTGGFELWQKCMLGDKEAWAKMKKYNANDVLILEKLYLKLRPWIQEHPNMRLFSSKSECPKCGSGPLQSRGEYVSRTRVYQRYYCKACNGWSRAVKSVRSSQVV